MPAVLKVHGDERKWQPGHGGSDAATPTKITPSAPTRIGRVTSFGGHIQLIPRRHSEIENLLSADSDEIDAARGTLQARIRNGDATLAAELEDVASNDKLSADDRALALDTLAGARSPNAEPVAVRAIRQAMLADDDQLRLAAVAAITHLSRRAKIGMRPLLERLRESSGPRLARAAAAALRFC